MAAGLLERGFKTWAENVAVSIRRDLDLPPHAPLSAHQLAKHLDVTLWVPGDVPNIPAAVVEQLLLRDSDGWSAVTCLANGHARVIYNPTHSLARQNSDIAHELAHIILEHEPGKIVMSHDARIVMRSFDPKQEEEANWLGWSLLLPRTALTHATKAQLGITEIAKKWVVSEQLVEYRTRMTGIRRQFGRSRGIVG
jgi:Zn-dependent peptidase ImmA (M78 family)